MILAPVGRLVKTAGPDAPACCAGSRLLLPIEAGGSGQTLRHHELAEVLPGDRAAREETVVLVLVFGAAIDFSIGEERRHAITGGAAARPAGAVAGCAILRQFWGVDAQQADAIVAQPEAVAVAGASVAGHGWRRGIEPRGDQREPRQDDDGE
jgi:hypothetical protein